MKGTKKLTLGIGNFNNHIGKKGDGFEGIHGAIKMWSKIWKVECCWNSAIRRIYVDKIQFKKKEKRQMTYSSDGNETKIDFVLVKKESRKFLKDVKMIPWKLQYRLIIVDAKKENLFKHMQIKIEHLMGGIEIKRKSNKKKI